MRGGSSVNGGGSPKVVFPPLLSPLCSGTVFAVKAYFLNLGFSYCHSRNSFGLALLALVPD